MCEKICGYKTFAHIFVCSSTRLSETGFILPMPFRPSSAHLPTKQVTTLSIIHAQNKHKRPFAAKTPLLTRVGVARPMGWRNQIRPFRHHLIERCSAILREQGSNDSLIVRAVRRVQERMTANGQ